MRGGVRGEGLGLGRVCVVVWCHCKSPKWRVQSENLLRIVFVLRIFFVLVFTKEEVAMPMMITTVMT